MGFVGVIRVYFKVLAEFTDRIWAFGVKGEQYVRFALTHCRVANVSENIKAVLLLIILGCH